MNTGLLSHFHARSRNGQSGFNSRRLHHLSLLQWVGSRGSRNPVRPGELGGFPQPRRSQFQGRFRWCCSVANRQRPDRLQFRGPAGPQFWVGIESSRSRSASSEEPGNGRQNRCPPPLSPFSGRVAFLVARFQKQSTHVGSGSATIVIFLVQCIAFLLFTIIFCVEIDVLWNPTLSS